MLIRCRYFQGYIKRKGLFVHPKYQRQGYVDLCTAPYRSTLTDQKRSRIATLLCQNIQDLATRHDLRIGVVAYSSSAPVHKKLGYTTLEHLIVCDDRPNHPSDTLDLYFQEWTPALKVKGVRKL